MPETQTKNYSVQPGSRGGFIVFGTTVGQLYTLPRQFRDMDRKTAYEVARDLMEKIEAEDPKIKEERAEAEALAQEAADAKRQADMAYKALNTRIERQNILTDLLKEATNVRDHN